MLAWLGNDAQVQEVIWGRQVTWTVLLAFFAAAAVLSIYLYRQRSGMPNWVRGSLLLSRWTALCLIVAVIFEPSAVISKSQTSKRRLPILVDASGSMSIKDQRKLSAELAEAAAALGFMSLDAGADVDQRVSTLDGKQRREIAEASRLQLAKTLITKTARPLLDSLQRDLDISYYAFGDSVQLLTYGEAGADNALGDLESVQPGTAIVDSLEAIANINRDVPMAGVVLLTDGLDTSPRAAEMSANKLVRQGVPIFTIPIGVVNPDDLSIRAVVIQDVAFTGDKVPVRVQIQSNGYEKRSVSMSVRLNDEPVAQRQITLIGGLQFEDVFFRVDVRKRGAARVDIELEPFSDEATAANNRQSRSIRIVNEKVNVLCMEGSARWEFRYLRAMLKRDPRISATFVATRGNGEMALNSSEYIPRFPSRREDAFAYDLVILGDVDASFFSLEELNVLEELVRDRGGSLVMLCGYRHAPTSYADTVLSRMLPVEFEPGGDWEKVGDGVYPVLTPEGRNSLVLTLEHERELNDLAWARVAPLDRLPPLLGAKPGATVLAELSNTGGRARGFPLIAWQRYGTGKVMTIGTDRLWLLRFKTGDKYHWRVWSQCIQFLTLSRLMGEHKRYRLETDRVNYRPDQQALLYAHLLDDDYAPVIQKYFDVNIVDLDQERSRPVRLRPVQSSPGLYEGYFSPPNPGRFRLEANADDLELASTTEFQVADISLEMVDTSLQLERLRRLSALSGGQCLTIGELGELPALLNREPQVIIIETDQPLWDSAWLMLLLVALLGTEWIVRRRYDLS